MVIYNVTISFPGVDFPSISKRPNEVPQSFQAQILSSKNKIEIKILTEPKIDFGRKFGYWITGIDNSKFGSYINVSDETQNYNIQKIDISGSSLIGMSYKNKQLNNKNFCVLSIQINCAKFIFKPNEEKLYSAEFYMNRAGFNVVKSFYATLFEYSKKFELRRMKDMEEFYEIYKGKFRPEFNFKTSDDRSSSKAKITKQPKIQFYYDEDITLEEAFKNADIIRLLSVFYFHSLVDYTFSKVYLKDETVIFQKVHQNKDTVSYGSLWEVKNQMSFQKLLLSKWQQPCLKNYELISKSIMNFIQAVSLIGSSEFLLFYTIIEIIKGSGKKSDTEFTLKTSKPNLKIKYNQALKILMQTIQENEHNDFKKRWDSILVQLKYRTLSSTLNDFFVRNNINPDDLPLKPNKIVKLRNDLIHGSTNKIDENDLKKTNILMYRLNVKLIMNLIGNTDWKMNYVL